jgi:hypothetical protein
MIARVDVVVPCYNYGRYLRACVESVLRQENVDVRVLVLDDASQDDTAEVGRVLAASDPRVEFRRHAVNAGHITTYNEGLDWASGEFYLLLSADDALTPGSLARACRLMSNHPEVGFVYGREIIWTGDDCPPFETVAPPGKRDRIMSGADFLQWMCQTADNPVATPTAIVRTSLQHQIGGYRHDLPHTGDFEMWLRLAAHGAVGFIDSDQAYWRKHRTNMRLDYRGELTLRQHEAAFDALFGAFSQRIERAEHLKWSANRALAVLAYWQANRLFDLDDREGCQRMLDLAVEFDPTVVRWPQWWRLRIKRIAGARAWSLVRPLVGRLRNT